MSALTNTFIYDWLDQHVPQLPDYYKGERPPPNPGPWEIRSDIIETQEELQEIFDQVEPHVAKMTKDWKIWTWGTWEEITTRWPESKEFLLNTRLSEFHFALYDYMRDFDSISPKSQEQIREIMPGARIERFMEGVLERWDITDQEIAQFYNAYARDWKDNPPAVYHRHKFLSIGLLPLFFGYNYYPDFYKNEWRARLGNPVAPITWKYLPDDVDRETIRETRRYGDINLLKEEVSLEWPEGATFKPLDEIRGRR